MLLNRLRNLREEVSTSNVGTVSDLGTPPKAGVPTRRITDVEVLRRGTTVCPECGEKDCSCEDMPEYVVGTKTDLGVRPSSPPPKNIVSHDYDFQDQEVENCPACGGRLAKDYCIKCKEFTSDMARINAE